MLASVGSASATIAEDGGGHGLVAFLSDAMESVVNLVATLGGLWRIQLVPDAGPRPHVGHGNSEYLAAAVTFASSRVLKNL